MFAPHAALLMTPALAFVALAVHLLLKVAIFAFIIWTLRDLNRFIAAVNAIGSQPLAMLLIGAGFFMMLVSKWYGIDTTIAGGVIGTGLGILKPENHKPESPAPNPIQPVKPAEE